MRSPVSMLSLLFLAGCAAGPFVERSSVPLAPGVTYTHYRSTDTNEIHVVAVDLGAKGIRLEAGRARGLVRTSSIAQDASRPEAPVLAAVNADFFSFSSGWPVGIQVHDGEIWTALETRRSHLLIDEAGDARIERITLDGSASVENGVEWTIDAVNQPVPRHGTTIYSSRWYDSTAGFGIRLRTIDPSFRVGAPFRAVADSIGPFMKEALESDEVLLIVGERSIDSLSGTIPSKGDTLTFRLALSPHSPGIREVLGGAGRLLRSGNPVFGENIEAERLREDFMTRRHPRTFIGISDEGRRLFLCVVDGRQKSSVGMTFPEMTTFLQHLGAYEGFNFDGGGSSAMVANGRIVNSPSDRIGERPVANALLIRRIP